MKLQSFFGYVATTLDKTQEEICLRCNGTKQKWDGSKKSMEDCYLCQATGKVNRIKNFMYKNGVFK